MSYAEKYISQIVGTRFKIAITHIGGSAIDVDNQHDYRIICERHQEWEDVINLRIKHQQQAPHSLKTPG